MKLNNFNIIHSPVAPALADNGGTRIEIYNGADLVFREIYSTRDEAAAERAALQNFDIFTHNAIYELCGFNLHKLSNNTYQSGEFFFCRIDNTEYFKAMQEPENGWIVDKNGRRIIDK